MKFIIGDYETGELIKVTARGPEEALRKYLCFVSPNCHTEEDLEYAVDNFTGKIWSETDIRDFAVLTREGLTREGLVIEGKERESGDLGPIGLCRLGFLVGTVAPEEVENDEEEVRT